MAAMDLLSLVPLHLGSLHAYESALVMLLAFGPFVVLVPVILRIRKRDVQQELAAQRAEAPGSHSRVPTGERSD
jgi:hypothetical protein